LFYTMCAEKNMDKVDKVDKHTYTPCQGWVLGKIKRWTLNK